MEWVGRRTHDGCAMGKDMACRKMFLPHGSCRSCRLAPDKRPPTKTPTEGAWIRRQGNRCHGAVLHASGTRQSPATDPTRPRMVLQRAAATPEAKAVAAIRPMHSICPPAPIGLPPAPPLRVSAHPAPPPPPGDCGHDLRRCHCRQPGDPCPGPRPSSACHPRHPGSALHVPHRHASGTAPG